MCNADSIFIQVNLNFLIVQTLPDDRCLRLIYSMFFSYMLAIARRFAPGT
jgi:hypothetical protein